MTTRAVSVAGMALALSACAQFTTSATERATLQATASRAGDAYLACIVDASDRYQQTGEDAGVIVEVSKKACTSARANFLDANVKYLKTRYMRAEPIAEQQATDLEERATAEIKERVLNRKAAAAPVARPSAMPSASAASPPASPPPATTPADGSDYMNCMRKEGGRYASVNEPATVIAEVAQSRCGVLLSDPATAPDLERQGRALVMGMVLDRKAGQP